MQGVVFFNYASLIEIIKVHLFLNEVADAVYPLSAIKTNKVVLHVLVKLELNVCYFEITLHHELLGDLVKLLACKSKSKVDVQRRVFVTYVLRFGKTEVVKVFDQAKSVKLRFNDVSSAVS